MSAWIPRMLKCGNLKPNGKACGKRATHFGQFAGGLCAEHAAILERDFGPQNFRITNQKELDEKHPTVSDYDK
jgi:hypothetical protein